MRRKFISLGLLFLGALVMDRLSARADLVDETIAVQMRRRHIPGLSLAIIQDGAIVKAQGYGCTDQKGSRPVTADTLFQAGSVSKPIAALGALHLVEVGKLSLDADVNDVLRTWHVPENDFTKKNKVTLRRLLSHSAGMTVSGFPGYAVGATMPTLVQVLDGVKPANTPAIRVDLLPGSKQRYSGGGYTIVQQLIIDATSQPFPQYMRENILQPLEMHASTYEQPLPADLAPMAATGHLSNRKAVSGRWRIYPEMAAAGLWTTPSDLARFAIALQQSMTGRNNPVISTTMTREMLTPQIEDAGLGVFFEGTGPTQRFGHDGRDEGFDTMLTAYVERGQGAVIMMNANDDSSAVHQIMLAIAKVYGWPGYPPLKVWPPIEDKEPEVTAQIRSIFDQYRAGTFDRTLFTEKFARVIAGQLSDLTQELQALGPLKTIALVRRRNEGNDRLYKYLLTYQNDAIFVNCTRNRDGVISRLEYYPD
jgi:CubicO group peptidase (beta-lactamase class C family)